MPPGENTNLADTTTQPAAADDRPDAGEHLNLGMVTLRAAAKDGAVLQAPMTVIVSGVGRSGTSMVAKVLASLGVPMGRTDGLAVFEDQEFAAALFEFDYNRTRQLIEAHDSRHERWGFKFASIQNHIFPPQLEYFRNPRLIVVMRDVIAIASRSYASDPEVKSIKEALLNVTKQTHDMMHFVECATCPTLLVSYEKFIAFPDKAIDEIAAFCGITVTCETRREARRAIEPNNPKYIALFHPSHRGNFDSVEEGVVIGWCALNGSDEPVEVELVADGVVKAVAKADVYRPDLLAAGIGTGFHGFRFDIAGLDAGEETVLQVRTADGSHTVFGSGRRLGDFPGR
jgi:hypothetical protein